MAARHRQRWQRRALVFDAMVPWIPMLVGIAIMAGYVIYAVVLSVGDRSESTLSPPDPSAFHHTPAPLLPPSIRVPTPGGDESEVVVEPARGTPPRVSPPPPPPPPPPSPPPAPPPAAPAPPALEGTYRLDGLYRHAFIGKVVISNPGGEAQDWVVELEFPDSVGRLNTFWVDGTPQPTKERSGDRYVFTSTVPVEGRSTVVLKFHFDFFGRDITPTLCTVNGNACDI